MKNLKKNKFTAFMLGAFIGSVVVGANVWAIHPEVSLALSNFEIDTDANLKVDDTSPPSLDWANVTENRKPDGNITVGNKTGDSSLGQGTSEDTEPPTVTVDSIPPNKSDLKFFGIYQEGGTSNGFLNLFWSRVQDPSGTTNMDFELNRRDCTPNTNDADCSANGYTPIRSAGDLLIQYDLSNGGTNPHILISSWVTTGPKSQCEAANSTPCWSTKQDLTGTGSAGSINMSAIPVGDSDDLGAHSARTFGEAQISFSVLFPNATCQSFGSAYLKSRSSDAFTSALKDIILPIAINISNCAAITIQKTDDATPPNNLSGAEFKLYNDLPVVGTYVSGTDTITNPLKSCTTGANGTCTIQDIFAGNYCIVETTTPTGYDTAAPQCVAVVADANATYTFVNPRQRGAISVVKTAKHKGPDGSANLVATFTVKKAGVSVGTITTDASGNGCLGDLLLGTYTVEETNGPAGYAKDTDVESATVTKSTCAAGSATVSFQNVPLSDIEVKFTSQVFGATKAKISCTGLTATPTDITPSAYDDETEAFKNLVPGVYNCTIDVDP